MQQPEINAAEPYSSNIRNLTDLWKAMGARATAADSAPHLQASLRWPDRLWFDVETQPTHSDALRLIEVARAASRPLVLPAWRPDETRGISCARQVPGGRSLAQWLREGGFKVAFEQTLMALKLENWIPRAVVRTDVQVHNVERDSDDWAETASRSFGYTVPPEVTDQLVQDPRATLLLARLEGRPVGTGLLYADHENAGLHMLGVPPEARRKGIARTLMLRLLDDARSQACGFATLQASSMGESLYRHLGFSPHGRILNFRQS